MAILEVTVCGKHAAAAGGAAIVCGNSDYRIQFMLDEEWQAYETKTARFCYRRHGQPMYEDVVFTGDTVEVPALHDIYEVAVGVYAGDICTTTPARIPCTPCITDGAPVHDPPAPDIYNQLMQRLAELRAPVSATALHLTVPHTIRQAAISTFRRQEES